jgi:class 3 adenylate cyclase/HAMP domain-containing protein
MRIRLKLLLIVLPLVVTPLLLVSLAAVLAARNGITQVATSFLQFKAEELRNYAETQWKLLQDNNLADDPAFVAVSKMAVESFARSLIRSDSELILALESGQGLAFCTSEVEPTPAELARLAELAATRKTGWQQVRIGGTERVGQGLLFEPFEWYLLVSERREAFYQAVNQIVVQSGLILVVTLAAAMILLFVFIRYITRPLGNVVGAMKEIISTSDLSRRVDLAFKDEIGELGHTFNIMTGELQKAYNQIKSYAFSAVVAQKKEQKIRQIFQKYVPAEVIDQYFANPESMLVGDNRVLAVMFSDIRGFTSIAEGLHPEQIVESLNAYFELMVDIIVAHKGTPDKFIGDAIMAFFGAPVKHPDDAEQAVQAGFEMLAALKAFNVRQIQWNRPSFSIGIGLNYGVVTVGNIGHREKKMDYTVIGDMVNLASRLEGLTKTYHVPFLVSESVYRKIGKTLPCRQVDRVVVRGKKESVNIYQPRNELSPQESKGWELYGNGISLYYQREFQRAAQAFKSAQACLPDDTVTKMFIMRCDLYAGQPPAADWTGAVTIAAEE